jgi:ribose 5-phosphate isomerase A
MTDAAEPLKQAAAREALGLVEDGMIVGLGSGSTSEVFLTELAQRVARGLTITGVPTSERVASLARSQGIPLARLEEVGQIDLAVDGADEIQPPMLHLIKGRGGALLREKLVASAASRLCIVADSSKLVKRLGERQPVPVAVVPVGWRQTADRIRALGGDPVLRLSGADPLVTDDQLYILDCRFGPIADPDGLGTQLKGLLGVVEHGIFVGLAERAIVASENGIVVLEAKTVAA